MNSHSLSINSLYDNLTYLDTYGSSVIIVVIFTFIIILSFTFSKIIIHKKDVYDDWNNQRCKPTNIPFASFINPDVTIKQNFDYCVQQILTSSSEPLLQPLSYSLSFITNIFSDMADSVQNIRSVTNNLRTGIQHFGDDVFNRLINLTVPLQQMYLSVIDTFGKINAITTASLFTMLGSYYTLQSLMGAILDFIIKILTALSIMIVGLWLTPFTWPTASAMTAVFLSISIPLAVIVYFMNNVLHIKAEAIPKLRCFHPNTIVTMHDNSFKPFHKLNLGDVLIDGSVVTTKFTLDSNNLDIYNLFGIVVSGTHKVKYNNKWIDVEKHPDATLVANNMNGVICCLNTSTKIIKINGIEFSDWDELYDDKLNKVLRTFNIDDTKDIYAYTNDGYDVNALVKMRNGKNIALKHVKIGDELYSGGKVYGIVELNTKGISKYKYLDNCPELHTSLLHLLTSNGHFMINNKYTKDYNNYVDRII